jgi:hypothetical protein
MLHENIRRGEDGNAASKRSEYWPQNPELFLTKEMGFKVEI